MNRKSFDELWELQLFVYEASLGCFSIPFRTMPTLFYRKKSTSGNLTLKSEPQLVVRRLSGHKSRSIENLQNGGQARGRGSERENHRYENISEGDGPTTNSRYFGQFKNWQLRVVLGTLMIALFTFLVCLGHLAMVIMAIVIQTAVYREVINVAYVRYKERKLAWFRSLNWYFLLCAYYFLFGESLIERFKDTAFSDAFLLPLANHHRFISFCLYLAGLMLFVMNLQRGQYKFQFNQFGLTHMALLLVIVQAQFVVHNIFEGLFWFILPVVVVVVNDIMAYVFGKLLGRTPLIQLSPKKTWEGFLGAFVATVVFGFVFSGFLARFKYLTCPVNDLSNNIFSGLTCSSNRLFELYRYKLPVPLVGFLRLIFRVRVKEVELYPAQLHSLAFSIFASLIAPFGGFFASGFKRAFRVKDFSDSIPGHGGMTDRMDCQFLMGSFVYLYFASFLKHKPMTVGTILEMAVNSLSSDDQRLLYLKLQEYLIGQELLAEPGLVL